MSYLERKQTKITTIAEVEKSSSSMIILAEKSMCPIAFCIGPNPPMNIDLSLKPIMTNPKYNLTMCVPLAVCLLTYRLGVFGISGIHSFLPGKQILAMVL